MAGELALAIVLLTGAGLMLRSFWRMNTYPPGFAPEKILVMRVALSGPQYNVWLREAAYIHELMRRIETAPGVQAVGIDRSTLNITFKMEGAPPSSPGHEPEAAFRAVSPGYLRALGVPLIKGSWPRMANRLTASWSTRRLPVRWSAAATRSAGVSARSF